MPSPPGKNSDDSASVRKITIGEYRTRLHKRKKSNEKSDSNSDSNSNSDSSSDTESVKSVTNVSDQSESKNIETGEEVDTDNETEEAKSEYEEDDEEEEDIFEKDIDEINNPRGNPLSDSEHGGHEEGIDGDGGEEIQLLEPHDAGLES